MFLKNRNIISKIKRSKVTDYAALILDQLNSIFDMEIPIECGNKSFSNGPGHMTKMVTTPIYGKTLLNSFSPEPEGR